MYVHAAISIDGRLALHRTRRSGVEHLSLPGGRVRERESAFEALCREVYEEIGLRIEVGPLIAAGEVFRRHRRQDLVLVFEARPDGDGAATDAMPSADGAGLVLIDPAAAAAREVMPPVLGDLRAGGRCEPSGPVWLGNIYRLTTGRA